MTVPVCSVVRQQVKFLCSETQKVDRLIKAELLSVLSHLSDAEDQFVTCQTEEQEQKIFIKILLGMVSLDILEHLFNNQPKKCDNSSAYFFLFQGIR